MKTADEIARDAADATWERLRVIGAMTTSKEAARLAQIDALEWFVVDAGDGARMPRSYGEIAAKLRELKEATSAKP